MRSPALLLGNHLSHRLAAALSSREIDAAHAATWQGGAYREASDEALLIVAGID